MSRDPGLRNDVEAVADRVDRFKGAMSSKSPPPDLAAQSEAVLPFLP